MDLENQINELKTHLANCEKECLLLKSGRKASSARVRKSLMEIKKSAHSMRSATTDFVKSLPTKSKAKEKKTEEPAPEPVEAKEPKKKRINKKQEKKSPE